MKKLIQVLSALLLMLSAFPQIQAQDLNSNLVRNRLAVKYPYMLGSGTPFAYQYDYVRGSILYDKVLYEDVLLNLNSEMGEVSIKINPEYHPTVLETNLVEWFTLGDRRFENIGGTYYEVLSQGNAMTLYKKISKYYSEQIEGQQLKKNFTDINTFFVDSGEGMVQIKNAKAVYKNYPESRKEVKSALSMLKGKEEKMKTAAVIINGMTPEKEALTMPEGPFEKVRGALAAGSFAAVAVQGISTELPAGYFRPSATSSRSAVLDSLEKGATVASIQNKVYEFGTKEHKSGGKVTITGYVRDAKSSEPLAGVVVYDEKSGTYTST
ncbi:MAG: hypothetical protein HUJ93_02225, partial [Bacteroidales bacterium]|nr:hypothetical protein [Bacteroidales bacterium]